MHEIKCRNVTEGMPIAVLQLKHRGEVQESQHGTTIEYPEPVSVCYKKPLERVLFNEKREPNPFFQFFESLWIIAGREDVGFLTLFNKNMFNYSDDGERYYGAYGFRLRNIDEDGDDFDQISLAIARLKANPDDRQVVLTIRRQDDLWYTGKDTPCNLMVACKIRDNKLNIHVFNRSNDLIWGMMGTNVVQFSMLQEYMAGKIGCKVGTYHQTTDSMHVYVNEQWDKVKEMNIVQYDPYYADEVRPYPMISEHPEWENDLANFFLEYDTNELQRRAESPFFKEVVYPMYMSWVSHKSGARDTALGYAKDIEASDWRKVCLSWLNNRYTKKVNGKVQG